LKILKGAINPSSNSRLRQGLVIGQFVISIFLIAATLLISSQLKFLSTRELGFNEEAIVLVDLSNSDIRDNAQSFKSELLASSNIESMTFVSGEPGGFHDVSTFIIDGIDENPSMRTLFTDHEYLGTFEIDLVEGRNFSETEDIDSNGGMILNETAVKELGTSAEDIIGRRVTMRWIALLALLY